MPRILLVWFIFFQVTAMAQLPNYHARIYDADNGLSATSINDIFKDRQDFLWIVYNDALEKFDGRTVEKFSFGEPVVHFVNDRNDNTWVIGPSEIYRINKHSWRFERVPFDTGSNNRLSRIFQLPGKPVTLLTASSFFEWDENSRKFLKVKEHGLKPSMRNLPTYFDTCGSTIFFPGSANIYAYHYNTDKIDSVPAENLSGLYAFTESKIAFIKYDGYSFWADFKNGSTTMIDVKKYGPVFKDIIRIRVTGVVQISDSTFLVLTTAGLMEYNIQKDEFTRKVVAAGGKPFEYETSLSRLFIDDGGILWAQAETFVTAFSPGNKILGLLRNKEYDPALSWNNSTTAFAEDNKKGLWMSTGFGFTRLDMQSGRMEVFQPEEGRLDRLSHGSIRGVLFDGKNVIIAPTDKGVWIFDPNTKKYTRPLYESDSVKKMAEHDFYDMIYSVKNGDHLFPGRDRLYIMDAKNYKMRFLDIPPENNNVVYQDSKGNILVGTNRSIYCYDEGYHYIGKLTGDLPNILCFFESSPGEYLVGTNKGLMKLVTKNNRGVISNIHTGLDNIPVTIIYRDKLNRYWLGSNNGLFMCDASFGSFRKFDNRDNIQSQLFSPTAFIRTGSGMVFMGGRHGVNYFVPEDFALEDYPLNVQVRSIFSNNTDTLTASQFQDKSFAYNKARFVFNISVPYYFNSNKVEFRYRFKSQDTTWISNGNSHIISFTELPPDKYELEIAASTNGKTWYGLKKPLLFTVSPPFWKTAWFVVLFCLLLIGLFVLLIKKREQILLKEKQRQFEVEQLKNENLQYQLETEQVMNYFSTSLTTLNTVDEVLKDITRNCISRLGFEDCVIYLVDKERNVLVQKAAWGDKSSDDGQIVEPIEIPVGKGITGTVAANGMMELINDTTVDPRYILDVKQGQSEMAIPVMIGTEVVAVIDTENSKKQFYKTWHQQIMQAIATMCANKIELIRKEEERMYAQVQVLENERKAAVAKLQSMRLQMNPHFLFNALNSIQQMIMTGNEQNATLYLSKFSKLLRMVLTHSDREAVSLKEELEILKLYIELESLRFDESFTYQIKVADGIDAGDMKVPTLLIQPFVENAIWHGLLHKEGERRLDILFDSNENDELVCTIYDNGIGRKAAKAFVGRSAQVASHTGKGVSVASERLKIFNEQNGDSSKLEIIDQEDDNGHATGTTIIITLPNLS